MKKHTIIICLILISIGLSEDRYKFLYPKINLATNTTYCKWGDDCINSERKYKTFSAGSILGFQNGENKFGLEVKLIGALGGMLIYERSNLLPFKLNFSIGGGVDMFKSKKYEVDVEIDNTGIFRIGKFGIGRDFYPNGPDQKRLIFNYEYYFMFRDCGDCEGWDDSHSFSISYPLFESKVRARVEMPLPPLSSELGIPEKVGNAAIDYFIDTAYELHNKLTNLKDKLANISDDLNKANQVLTEIDNHPNGVLGWGENQIVITFYKALKGPDVNVDANPDIQTILDIFNSSEGEFMEKLLDAIQTGITSNEFSGLTKEKLLSLDIKYDPTEAMRKKMEVIKDGLLGSSLTLASILDDIKAIGVQAKDLLQSSTKLTSEAQGLGLKAPKAIKAIKNTTNLIKDIPNEVSEIGNEANQVIEEVKNVTDSIQGILSSF